MPAEFSENSSLNDSLFAAEFHRRARFGMYGGIEPVV
jgi:hypothetical protein